MKSCLFVIVFLMVLAVVGGACFVFASDETVEIVSDCGWLDLPSDDSYLVVGEVENTGSKVVYEVRLSVTLYGSDNEVVLKSLTSTKLCAIEPGVKSPFLVAFNPALVQENQIHHHTIEIDSYRNQPFPPPARQITPNGLKIISNSPYTDSNQNIHIKGEIQNIETTTSNFTKIYATFYDSAGTVVFVQQAQTSPEHIEAGDTAPFDVVCKETNIIPLITSYTLTSESNNYGQIHDNTTQSPKPIQPTTTPSPSVPEFHLIPAATLLAIIPIIAILTKKRTTKTQ